MTIVETEHHLQNNPPDVEVIHAIAAKVKEYYNNLT